MPPHPPTEGSGPTNDIAPLARASDAALLVGVRQQHPAALQELYTRYFPAAYALAVRMLGDPPQAEACVQAVFLHLWQQPSSADRMGDAPSDWLLAAVHQLAHTQQRSTPPRRPPADRPLPASRPSAAPVGAPVDSGPMGSGREVARQQLAAQQAVARAAVAALPPVERTVLELAYFAGLRPAQIAAALPEALDTVAAHLRAGLAHLRTALAAGGGGPAAEPPRPPATAPAAPLHLPDAPVLDPPPDPPSALPLSGADLAKVDRLLAELAELEAPAE